MTYDDHIRRAEEALLELHDREPDESFVDLPGVKTRVRVWGLGSGEPVVMLHGTSLSAAAWLPWAGELAADHRLLLVDLPGHGLSDPVRYRRGMVRDYAISLIDDLHIALGLETSAIVGHSLGGMFALWYAAVRPERVSRLVAIGEPAVALPGATVRMPLSLLTVPVLGTALLRSPSPRVVYRRLLVQALGERASRAASDQLVDVLRLSARRRPNAHSVASLMRSIGRFRRPHAECVMTDDELTRVASPTLFCWGIHDPFLAPSDAEPHIARLPAANLRLVDGGHAPWMEDPRACADVVRDHLDGRTPRSVNSAGRLPTETSATERYRPAITDAERQPSVAGDLR